MSLDHYLLYILRQKRVVFTFEFYVKITCCLVTDLRKFMNLCMLVLGA